MEVQWCPLGAEGSRGAGYAQELGRNTTPGCPHIQIHFAEWIFNTELQVQIGMIWVLRTFDSSKSKSEPVV